MSKNNRDKILESKVILHREESLDKKKDKVLKALDKVLNASSFFTGYEIEITISSYYKDS